MERILEQPELFGAMPSVSTTTLSAVACGSEPVEQGTEVVVHIGTEGEAGVYRGLDRIAVLQGAAGAEARRVADGRREVFGRVQGSDPLLRTMRVELARRPRPQ